MPVCSIRKRLGAWLELLRWHKPSGRLILLIPALWSLWLTPMAPPSAVLVGWIVVGGLAVSAAGCIANDLWDRRIDPLVERTKTRPLADGRVGTTEAASLLLLSLVAAPARAGSVTAESIWDKTNAIQRAQSQVPAGATLTRTECTVVNVRTGNYRYICTVFYADPPAASAPTAPNPIAPNAPAP